MAYLEWSDKYLTGYKPIDDDHRMLFSLVNGVYDAVLEGEDEIDVENAIDKLVEYVDVHFAREEKLLEETGYPDLESHKIAHEKLRRRVVGYRVSYIRDPIRFEFDEFLKFMTGWLSGHIMKEDMAYLLHLAGKLDIED